MAWNEVDPIAWPISHLRKTMMTVFFGVNGIALIDILPEKTKLSFEYFKENTIKEFDSVVYLTKQKSHANHMHLHFDNALFIIRE
jgi:hypothetical protein